MIAAATVVAVKLMNNDNSQTATVTLASGIEDVYEAIEFETSDDIIKKKDESKHLIKFQRGDQKYVIKATPIGETTTEMQVTVEDKEPIKGDPALVLAQDVCQQLETTCELNLERDN